MEEGLTDSSMDKTLVIKLDHMSWIRGSHREGENQLLTIVL